SFNGYRRVDLKPTDGVVTFDIELTRGRTVEGKLVGPDGKPVAGATALGHPAVLKGDAFTAGGLYPGEERTLSFVHREHRLVGHFVVKGTEKVPRTVRLERWGAVTGRLVDPEGRPLPGVRLRLSSPPLPPPGVQAVGGDVQTDTAGRFRVE